MVVRFVCEDCRIKWFVPGTRPIDREPTECADCGGRLIPLALEHGHHPTAPDDTDAGP